MKTALRVLGILFVLVLGLVVASPVAAQDENPPSGGEGTWDPIVDEDGTVDVSNLIDLGEQNVSTDWMPDVPLFGTDIPATYHLYQDPGSGTVYMVPTVITYLYMAANPDESGLSDSLGALSGNAENSSGYATDAAFLAGIVSGNLEFSDYTEFVSAGYTSWTDFFQAVISGEEDIWSLPLADTFNFLTDMIQMSLEEGNLYTVILAYPPGMCDQLPGGCPEGMVTVDNGDENDSDVIIVPPQCPAPYTTTGAIVISGGPGAGSGGKLAPTYPIVVGQDPQRRGVDVQAQAVIPPIIYHYYNPVQRSEETCVQDDVNGTYLTDCEPAYLKFRVVKRIWYDCIPAQRTYIEYLQSATLTLSLTQNSRQWILTDLAQAYPGAHLIHPDFSFTEPRGGELVDGSVLWTSVFERIPLADPGYWTVTVRVTTTGTAVSAPRFATKDFGTFLVELVRLTLVGGMGGLEP